MFHRYQIVYENDADYIVWESLQNGEWIEHSRWMVPGSSMEN